MKAYLYVMVVAALVTYLTTGAARRFARRVGAITPVRERDVHTVPIPRLGGIAMYLGIALALLTAGQIQFFSPVFEDRSVYVVLISAGAVCLLGVMDDLWQLDAITKLAGQCLAAGLLAWQGIQLFSLPIFGTVIPSSEVLILVTVIAIVTTINAVNFVDGLDGLAAGIVAIAASAFFVFSYVLAIESSPQDYSSLASLIAAALVGACLGFLPHNFNPARIFMGDSGSMLIGLLLATCTASITGRVDQVVLAQAKIVPVYLPLLLPLAVLALPLIDLGLAVIRRTRAGRMPWQPDKMHLHHRMLGLGHSHAKAVLILYFWTATVGFGVALFALVDPLTAAIAGGSAMLIALVLTIGPGRRRGRSASRALPVGPQPGAGEPASAGSTTPQSTVPEPPDVPSGTPRLPSAAPTAARTEAAPGRVPPPPIHPPTSPVPKRPSGEAPPTMPRGVDSTRIPGESTANSRAGRG